VKLLIYVLMHSIMLFVFHATATTELYTLSLHDALPIYTSMKTACRMPDIGERAPARTLVAVRAIAPVAGNPPNSAEPMLATPWRSEEHTSELQSRENLVCRLLLEKKKKKKTHTQ